MFFIKKQVQMEYYRKQATNHNGQQYWIAKNSIIIMPYKVCLSYTKVKATT